jgi:hypothetical protein
MSKVRSLLSACLLTIFVLGVSGCADGDQPVSAPVSTSVSASTTTATSSVAPTSSEIPEPEPAPTVTEEATYESSADDYAEPFIVDCQPGLGPIKTFWSDGSQTGWSEYCQSVHDEALQGEVDANTAVCETELCIYPNGASYPNPNYRVVPTPSPWVQGQIDWQNCIDAGNTQDYCRSTLN